MSRYFDPEEVAEMARLYHKDLLSLGEIGRRYDRDVSSIRTAFIRAGVPIRDSREAFQLWRENRRKAEVEAVQRALA